MVRQTNNQAPFTRVLALVVVTPAVLLTVSAGIGAAAPNAPTPNAAAQPAAHAFASKLTCAPRQLPFTPRVNLSGEWTDGGGVVYLSEARGAVTFVELGGLGMPAAQAGYDGTHVFYGIVSGTSISGHWVDLPRGQVDNAYPLWLKLRIGKAPSGSTHLAIVASQGGNYGSGLLTPCRDPRAPR